MYASTRTAEELKYCNYLGVFNKTIITLAPVGFEALISSFLSGFFIDNSLYVADIREEYKPPH